MKIQTPGLVLSQKHEYLETKYRKRGAAPNTLFNKKIMEIQPFAKLLLPKTK